MNGGRVRALAVAVIRRNDEILVAEIPDEVKGITGYRPLGGTIEFGERGDETIVRELREELGAEIVDTRYLGTLENIFEYRGVRYHEIVRAYEARFADADLYEREHFDAVEERADAFVCTWRSIRSFDAKGPLYPEGLLALIG